MSKMISTGRVAVLATTVFGVLLGTALPAGAGNWHPADGPGAGQTPRIETIAEAYSVTEEVIVGLLGFMLIVGAAAAVLWFTAKNRHQEPGDQG